MKFKSYSISNREITDLQHVTQVERHGHGLHVPGYFFVVDENTILIFRETDDLPFNQIDSIVDVFEEKEKANGNDR